MPLFAGWLFNAFVTVATYLATFLTRRVAIAVAVTLVLLTMTTAFFAAIAALVAGLEPALPAGVVQGAALILPSNTIVVVSTYAAARIAFWAYHLNRDILNMYMAAM